MRGRRSRHVLLHIIVIQILFGIIFIMFEMVLICEYCVFIWFLVYFSFVSGYSNKDQKCYTKNNDGNRNLAKLYSKVETPIAILGAPFWSGQKMNGTELGPEYFRNQNIVNQIQRLGYNSVIDYGDLEFKINAKDKSDIIRNNFTVIHKQFTVSEANVLLENSVEKILRKGQTLVVLGGDHSITAGSILGNAKVNPDLCVIYVDAHGDINNCETTTSGNLHGIPLSFVINGMERLHKNFKSCPAMKVLKPLIPASAVVLIASRDLDDMELEIINEFNIKHYSTKDIDEIGMEGTVNQILSTVCSSKSKIHVSFDIDSVDAMSVPNTGTPVPGGLTVREALQLGEMIAKTKKLNVIEMYEVNPVIGPPDQSPITVNIAMNIILSFLGKSREVYWAQPWEGGWGERALKHKY